MLKQKKIMRRRLFFALVFSFFITAAFAQKDSSATTYKMVVTFSSFASGPPSSAPLLAYIKKFKKVNKLRSIKADHIGPLGREGEYKLAFKLNELTRRQRALFIKRVTALAATMKEKGSASVTENETINRNDIPERATVVTKKF